MRRFLPAAAALLLAGCGYVAGPLPPLANVPQRVEDLAAVQRGTTLIVQFIVPQRTTEGLLMKEPPRLDLRIGPGPVPFDADRWAAQARVVPPVPVNAGTARYEVAASEWIGHEVVVGVRVIGANGKEDGWAYAVVPVAAPPEKPHAIRSEAVHPEPGGTGLRLIWQAGGGHFRVLRAAGESDRYDIVATVTEPSWTDPHIDYGTRYRYLVQGFAPVAGNREVQSDLSEPFAITVAQPPPSVPAGLRAVAAPGSIELAWDADPEGTVAGYRIYRAPAGGELTRIAETSAVPTYSDHEVEHGRTYRYAVSAIDAKGQESGRSAVVEASLP